MGATLALDLGTKRIGLALNLVGSVVTDVPTIAYASIAEASAAIGLLVQDRDVTRIIVGAPRPGSPLESLLQTLADRLNGVEIVALDESLTTKEAERLSSGTVDTDALAARLLLEQYLATREQV